jgi:MFS family permease
LVLPVLPTIQANLHTSQSTVTWVLTAYLLAASVATPILGRLGDMMAAVRISLLPGLLMAGWLVALLVAVWIAPRHPWADGTTHLRFEPLTLLERLAVLA